MLNTLSHKGNTNQNYTKIPSHPSQNGHLQENNNKYWKGCGKKEPSYTVGVTTMKISMKVLKTLKINLPMTPPYHSWAYI
jgi:hypothetical protein